MLPMQAMTEEQASLAQLRIKVRYALDPAEIADHWKSFPEGTIVGYSWAIAHDPISCYLMDTLQFSSSPLGQEGYAIGVGYNQAYLNHPELKEILITGQPTRSQLGGGDQPLWVQRFCRAIDKLYPRPVNTYEPIPVPREGALKALKIAIMGDDEEDE